jgi:two-component system alkaline phosphatase synthesis response regulator PhoP
MNEQISVMIIEDEEHIRNILEYNLRLDGFDVYLAENGRKGLELVRQKMPDLILLDWMMPEMDGLEVLAKLKAGDKTKHIPVYMLTAKAMMSDVGLALSEGADDYIAKPFDSTELGQLIRSKLENLVKN